MREDPLAPFRSELLAHCYRMLGSSRMQTTSEAMFEPEGAVLWIVPYPDDPELSVVGRGSVELTFVSALQRARKVPR